MRSTRQQAVSLQSSPVSIQTQSLALRALRKWKPQETQAIALASSQSWLPLLWPSIPIGCYWFSFTQRKRLRLDRNRAWVTQCGVASRQLGYSTVIVYRPLDASAHTTKSQTTDESNPIVIDITNRLYVASLITTTENISSLLFTSGWLHCV